MRSAGCVDHDFRSGERRCMHSVEGTIVGSLNSLVPQHAPKAVVAFSADQPGQPTSVTLVTDSPHQTTFDRCIPVRDSTPTEHLCSTDVQWSDFSWNGNIIAKVQSLVIFRLEDADANLYGSAPGWRIVYRMAHIDTRTRPDDSGRFTLDAGTFGLGAYVYDNARMEATYDCEN